MEHVDLLTILFEGSVRVILEDGTPLLYNYYLQNGYRYSSIERVLVELNLISRQEMSAQRIRDWMAAHPEEAATVRAANRSYVFFRITGLSNEGEPVGAQGVPLTPGRSIAVDRVHEYGTPFFIEANLPIESGKSVSRFGRLMIAQDTGSALVGPARADLYWGAGDDAGRIAGRIRHPGRFAMLVPRELDLVAAGRQMPLPVPKPKIPEVDKTDGKGNASSPNAGAIATGKELPKHPPSPAPKPKMAASDVKKEVKKEDGKGRATSADSGAAAAGKQPSKHPAQPPSKPKMAASDVKKEGKNEDGKGKATSTDSGATVAGKQPPKPPALPPSKPKVPAIEVKKKDGKGKANSANTANSGEDWRATASSGRPSAPARMAN